MKCRSSAIALLVSLMASPRPDPLPELCTEKVEGELRLFEEAIKQWMHLPPAVLIDDDLAARKQTKENLISACIDDAIHRESAR